MTATRKLWTINAIQSAMNADGSHWWSASNMRFFGTRASRNVFNGDGGVFFVTSDQRFDYSRGYTVREFSPETLNVRTVGELAGYPDTRTASAAAKHMAGSNLVVNDEKHKPLTPTDDMRTALERAGAPIKMNAAKELIALAKRHHKACERQCNTGDDKPREFVGRLIAKLVKARTNDKVKVLLSGDPRGATVKLVLPNGETNDWGKDGYCVPTE